MKGSPPSKQILAIGDHEFYLSYDIDNNIWSKIERNTDIPLLKYPSIV